MPPVSQVRASAVIAAACPAGARRRAILQDVAGGPPSPKSGLAPAAPGVGGDSPGFGRVDQATGEPPIRRKAQRAAERPRAVEAARRCSRRQGGSNDVTTAPGRIAYLSLASSVPMNVRSPRVFVLRQTSRSPAHAGRSSYGMTVGFRAAHQALTKAMLGAATTGCFAAQAGREENSWSGRRRVGNRTQAKLRLQTQLDIRDHRLPAQVRMSCLIVQLSQRRAVSVRKAWDALHLLLLTCLTTQGFCLNRHKRGLLRH